MIDNAMREMTVLHKSNHIFGDSCAIGVCDYFHSVEHILHGLSNQLFLEFLRLEAIIKLFHYVIGVVVKNLLRKVNVDCIEVGGSRGMEFYFFSGSMRAR